MKNTLTIVLVALTSLAAIPCVAQKRENAVAPPIAPTNSAATTDPLSSFQLVVKKFTVFFSAGPRKLIYGFPNHDTHDTTKVFTIDQYSSRNIVYDVEKTNSLVSPYLATINISFIKENNSSCGDVTLEGSRLLGWSTTDGALSAIDRPECYRPDPLIAAKFVFAFQEGKWVFTDAVDVTKTADMPPLRVFLSIFGVQTSLVTSFSEPQAQTLNSAWRDLVQN
jgi:hypothetical protein